MTSLLKIFIAHHWMLAVTRGLCTISLAITLKSILGYLIYGMDRFHWIHDVAMALSTSICLFCVTLSVFFLSLVADKLLIEKFVTTRELTHDRAHEAA
jgi:hypothetical protein